MGRPTKYTPERHRMICALIANGMGLEKACNELDFVSKTTALEWLKNHEEFRADYRQAREDQAEHFADELIQLADSDDDPAKVRNQIDVRKWNASKHAPRKYGDRVDVSATLTVRREITDDERARALGLMFAKFEDRLEAPEVTD